MKIQKAVVGSDEIIQDWRKLMQLPWGEIIIKGIQTALPALWPLIAFLASLALIKFIYRLYEMKRLFRSGINNIDQMDGKTFEKYLESLFMKLGYRVERTKYVGDYGADLVVRKDGIKTIIQAKRYKNKVGVKAIQEAVAAKGYYKCQKAMVVTNSFYTKQAINLAGANEVALWDRKDLVKKLLSVKGNVSPKTAAEKVAIPEVPDAGQGNVPSDNICNICGETVSDKVKQYCLDHSDRFAGKIYCFRHQKGVKSVKSD